MDTYLYGLLGLSLAANAFSAISTLVANSKKRDDENQRTIASIYEELNRKIDDELSAVRSEITLEIDSLRREFNEGIESLYRDIEDINDKIYGTQEYDLDSFGGTETKVSPKKTKKRN